MEIDWPQRELTHATRQAERLLTQLRQPQEDDSFIDRAFQFLIRFLEIPRQASNPALDLVMLQVTQELYHYIQPRGYWNQIAAWWPQLKTIADSLGDPALQAEITKELAIIRNNQGQSAEALSLYHEMVDSSDFHHLPTRNQVDILHQIGVCYVEGGDYVTSVGYLKRCVAISETHQHAEFKAYALNQLGNIALWQGDLAKAGQYYKDCLTVFEADGEGDNLACVAYQSLGRWSIFRGCIAEAVDYLHKGLAIRYRRQDRDGAAYCAIYLAEAYIQDNQLAEAQYLLVEAIQTCKALQHQLGEAMGYLAFARLEAKRGLFNEAIRLCRQSLDLLTLVPMPVIELQAVGLMGVLSIRTGQLQTLLPLLNRLRAVWGRQSLPLRQRLRFFALCFATIHF